MSPHSDEQTLARGDWGRFECRVFTEWLDDGRDMRLVEPFAYVDAADTHWPAPADRWSTGRASRGPPGV
jgi:hypothetical protein